ncbi:hypothetical protein [uncultured Aquimarina sp.]|uniref:hypothetical protein n=1 Tax=uncultured Aquimarina sp. TaxID=575652 RepID=UPI0026333A4F|nr:hypothetical protein [uncultured Aquimarina sp.]
MIKKSNQLTIKKIKALLLLPFLCAILAFNSITIGNEIVNNNTLSDPEPTCINKQSKYDKGLDNYLKIKTNDITEALIYIVNTKTSETIRTVHLKPSQFHKVKNIPEGIHRVDVIYGTNYTETSENESCKGYFKNVLVQKKLKTTINFEKVQNYVPSYSLLIDIQEAL